MLLNNIYGHSVIKNNLVETVINNRISHALLLMGPQGCGKLMLAISFAQFINCLNKTENDACGKCNSCLKFNKLVHPDLHFVYPVVRTPKFSKPVSDDFLSDWRKFLLQSKFHSVDDWLDTIGADNLQGSIFAQESQEIIRKLNLKTFEAEYKTMIIWMPEKMNTVAANKLLKMIEEPPSKTLFLLVTENEEDILNTIRSRTQLIKLTKLSENELYEALKEPFPNMDHDIIMDAIKISNGNFLEAEQIITSMQNTEAENPNFKYFTQLMRSSYGVKIDELMVWTDAMATLGREKQKIFFQYALRMLRECFIYNLMPQNSDKINFMTKLEMAFAQKFAIFVHKNNISQLTDTFNLAHRHIERNAYNKLVFIDLALKTTQLLKLPNN